MSAARRAGRVITGVLMILGALLMILLEDLGYYIICVILAVALLVAGIRMLIGYITLDRFMVGGRRKLYLGIIILDLGIFALTLANIPKIYVVLYLVGIHAFSGAVSILRAMESRKYDSPTWKYSFAEGIANILIGVMCLIFIRQTWIVVIIYSAGLIYSAVFRIASAFKKTAVIYIQ